MHLKSIILATIRIGTALGMFALIASCASSRVDSGTAELPAEVEVGSRPDAALAKPAAGAPTDETQTVDRREEIVERGTDTFIRAQRTPAGTALGEEGDVNLRFEDTEIREFVDVVLGDLLGVNYLIDPAVTGTVTIATAVPIRSEDLLPLFEEVLSVNGAVLLRSTGLYQVVPREAAERAVGEIATLETEAPGFRTQVIPLQFIAAQEMQKILGSIVTDPSSFRIDPVRNLIIVSGSQAEVEAIRDAIAIFDVDWLRGMSVGLYPLDYVDPETLERELEQVFGAATGDTSERVLGGIVRLVPIERLTSLLVVSSTSMALREVEIWIRRLDQPGESAGRRLYVYAIQNAKATELADILRNIFGSRAPAQGPDASSTPGTTVNRGLAPGLTPVDIGPGGSNTSPAPTAQVGGPQGSASRAAGGVALTGEEAIEIIADDVRNALVILASPQDYRMVETALRRLDVVPLQVMIEASILEVTLRDDLSYGVEWFFKNSIDGGDKDGFGTLDLGSPGIAALAPGFSYTVVDNADRVRIALNTLASESEVNVLSSPSLMVLDNQTATINVGDEIPVPTRQSISNIDPASPTVNEVSFRQTGISLTVTPRVNNSGLVTMEILQEVATAVTTTTSNIDAPTIQNRQIESVVAINSGDTIVLGGLIQDQQSLSESGLPGLYKIPVLGKLFGRTADEFARTELLILITPHVVRNQDDARRITEEFRDKLPQIQRMPVLGAGAETEPSI